MINHDGCPMLFFMKMVNGETQASLMSNDGDGTSRQRLISGLHDLFSTYLLELDAEYSVSIFSNRECLAPNKS